MKKFFFFAALSLLVSRNISAANFITIADSVRIKPSVLDGYTHQRITMVTDAYCDQWQVSIGYPDGLTPKLVSGIVPLAGMVVGYTDYDGSYQSIEATLSMTAGYTSVESRTCLPGLSGWYDYNDDGRLESYGTPKWEPGAHELFEMNLYVNPDFRGGYVTMDATFNSCGDTRGPILNNVHAFRKCWLWVGYMAGDVTGNEKLDISDVTELIDRVLGKTKLDEFSEKAADANCDGVVDIDDVTYITKKILG